MHDTWAGRDLPVLDATVALLEQSFMVTVTDIAARTGLEVPVVATALTALDPVYVDFRKTTTGGDPRFWYVFKVTPEARRAVGQWPTAEALATRLAEEQAARAGQEPDGERQALLAYAARLVGETLRDATVQAAGRVLAPAFGGVPVPELGQPVPAPEPEDDYPGLPGLSRGPGSRSGEADPGPGGSPAGALRPLPEADQPDQPDRPDRAASADSRGEPDLLPGPERDEAGAP